MLFRRRPRIPTVNEMSIRHYLECDTCEATGPVYGTVQHPGCDGIPLLRHEVLNPWWEDGPTITSPCSSMDRATGS